MNYNSDFRMPSATGLNDLFIQSVIPDDTDSIKKCVLIVHGMAEHTDRYLEVADFLAEKGLAVYMIEQAGHKRSAANDDELGFFGDKDGNEKLPDDVNTCVKLIKEKHPGKKIIVWGHSMGSFVTRRFAAKYPKSADAVIICGTSGANPAAALGAAIADLIGKVKGSHYRSQFINNLAFGSYNKKFEGNTGFEWLSVNKENINKYLADKYCGFLFTAYGYRDMFRLLGSVSGADWYSSIPKDFPVFLISGKDDPVGNYGKGVSEVFNKLKDSGHTNIKLKLYDNMRHEIHNETERFTVYSDIAGFIDSI